MSGGKWLRTCHTETPVQEVPIVAGRAEKPAQRDERRRSTAYLLQELARARGDAARRPLEDQLIALNLPVAHDVARRYHGRGISNDDLD